MCSETRTSESGLATPSAFMSSKYSFSYLTVRSGRANSASILGRQFGAQLLDEIRVERLAQAVIEQVAKRALGDGDGRRRVTAGLRAVQCFQLGLG